MKKIIYAVIIFLIIATGCKSSKITSSWKTQEVQTYGYNKVLVLGIVRDSDSTIQENMENHFVGDLLDLGYNAVSSMQEYGKKAFDGIDEETALDMLHKKGVDAVITIVLLDKAKETKYIPETIGYSSQGTYYQSFWGYRSYRYDRIYEPGYYVTDTKYFWESNFYAVNTPKLIYSVQTQSFEPSTTESMAHEYGRTIVKNMMKQKVLVKHPNTETAPKAF